LADDARNLSRGGKGLGWMEGLGGRRGKQRRGGAGPSMSRLPKNIRKKEQGGRITVLRYAHGIHWLKGRGPAENGETKTRDQLVPARTRRTGWGHDRNRGGRTITKRRRDCQNFELGEKYVGPWAKEKTGTAGLTWLENRLHESVGFRGGTSPWGGLSGKSFRYPEAVFSLP